METTKVWNRAQEITFVGELLADGSSQRPHKQRWYEVEIWKTDDGKYVIHKIGATEVKGEEDRHSAIIADTPEGAVQALYSRRELGDYHLPLAAKLALEDAAQKDPALRDAYLHRDLTGSKESVK
jgi:hypothetical protein